ncbi:tRNA (guanosine(46)-N7)-methyltransferase TrmB [bacterium SCSIO 12741]|nr:tRNA (guanosine(46)-N7)-methyltransferase TrmB [bacterium SCSIO 12741]
MGKKKKLIRFADMKTFSNVLQPGLCEVFDSENKSILPHKLAGKWREEVFQNDNPIVIELGCGKGEYSVGMARKFPNKNFIGVDIKGARIWYGAKDALDEGLNNAFFLRTRIDFITSFFAPGELDEIWITFPDPQPQENRRRKRLTNKLFTDRYKTILKPNGLVHLKTDSAFLHEFTLDEIQENGYDLLETTADLYGEKVDEVDPDTREILSIKTHYEQLFSAQGYKITYTKYRIH